MVYGSYTYILILLRSVVRARLASIHVVDMLFAELLPYRLPPPYPPTHMLARTFPPPRGLIVQKLYVISRVSHGVEDYLPVEIMQQETANHVGDVEILEVVIASQQD